MHPSSIKKHPSARLKNDEVRFRGHLKVKVYVIRFNISLLQSQTFLFFKYKNINIDLMVMYLLFV